MESRVCAGCNQEKPSSDFSPSTRHASGVKTHCKACRNEAKRLFAMTHGERMQKELERKERERKEKDLVPHRTVDIFAGTYKPSRDNPQGYERETGNKNIKSKGTLC